MKMAMDELSLAANFPQATREQWLTRVEGVLKGADFAKKLAGRTHEGIEIQLDHPGPEKANELALIDLENGANALTLVTRKAPAAPGFGVRAESIEDFDRTLAGIMLDLIHLRLDAGGKGRVMAERLIALCDKRGDKLSNLSLDLGMDPIGPLASQGTLSAAWDEVSARMGTMQEGLAGRGFEGRAFLADGRAHHEAGVSEAQELAAVLATGLAYLRALEARDHSRHTARKSLSFLLAADADEFLTVAAFRALRRLWARVEQAYGLEPRLVRLHAETTLRMMTKRDPWVNMLRATVATFSAGIGGANTATVLPFTAALGLPDAFASRMARNTRLILREESNRWRVADPAAGAGGFETLTEVLCEKAWALLQEIEREGGLMASLQADALQARIAAARAQRETAAATRKEPITGTSEFLNIHEADITVLMPSVPEAKQETSQAAVTIAALPSIRSAEAFERLRDRTYAYIAKTGARPKVFLANLGPISALTARATFAKTFFEAGGIEAIANDGFSSLRPLTAVFAASGTQIVRICSSDEVYFGPAEVALTPNETAAEETARELKRAGTSLVYMTGRPVLREDALRSAGIQDFIYNGCDLLAVVASIHSAVDGSTSNRGEVRVP